VDQDLDPDDSLFLSIEARLKRAATRCGASVSECEDCAQESWLALLETHPGWALDDSRTEPWLLVVCHNKAIDLHRCRNGVRVCQLDALPPFLVSDPSPIPRDANQDGQYTPKLQDGLKRLSMVNREILLLRVQSGLTYRKIGAAVGLRPELVKWRYYRILRQLKRTTHPSIHERIDGGGVDGAFRRELCQFPDFPS
jgi:RNA polymerase sigma factor (sigma-70 family)